MTGKRENHPVYGESIKAVLEGLDVDPEQGLNDKAVRRRRRRYGANRLQRTRRQSIWQLLSDQFKSVVIIVLVVAGILALSLGHWAEGIAIAAVIVVNAVLGFVTEWKAVRSMESLRKSTDRSARVRRAGRESAVAVEQLVPGDIVVVESGDIVPADARVLEANNLQVNESALTGESVAVRKQAGPVADDAPLAERFSMLYKGTTTTEGSGAAVVVATGMNTELGRIATLAERAQSEATPLQQRLDLLGRHLAWITLATAALIGVGGLIAGQDPTRMIETAIALGVAAIPEGLPIVATIALARGMVLMARRQALIKRLPAVETLGATKVIFTDKTGTLTENRMTLRGVTTPGGEFIVDENAASVDGDGQAEHSLLQRAVEIGVLCSNASLPEAETTPPADANQAAGEQGDPTETAILRAGSVLGLQRTTLLDQKPELREVPFDARRMMMATYHRGPDGIEVAVKGAPDRVIDACAAIAGGDGDLENDAPLDDALRRQWTAKAESMAGEGLRVLAVADKTVADADAPPYEGLRLIGILGLLDPAREDVGPSIEACRSAGIRVVMVTGDQPETAAAIARKVGIVDEDDPGLIHGGELRDPDEMTQNERRRALEAAIFARVSPEQKLHLVKLMQAEGVTVAMTGDGVNDAPALKKADIGVAMGRRGTDAARDVADMVLRDDAFSSIVAAVHQGRVIFDNIRRSVMFMLCTNAAEVIAVASASVAGSFSDLPIPLKPLQILYLNVVSDVFPALALSMGKGEAGVMARRPRPRDESVLTAGHWKAVAGWALLMAVCVLSALIVAVYPMAMATDRAVTVSFLTLAFGKLWFVYNLRGSESRLSDNDIVRNPFMAAAILLCIGLLTAAVYLPGLSDVLRTRDPGLYGWLLVLGVSLVPFVWGQLWRTLQRTTLG